MSTYNDASLIYYPSGYKAGTAYSLKPTDGSGDLTFTRASTATRVNESGLIESVATGVPRIDYTGAGCGKLLLEPQRTNLITYSEDFSNAAWTKSNCTLTSLYAPSILDGKNSFLITSTAFGANLATSVSSSDNTQTFFVKKGNWDFVQILNFGSSAAYANFDINNGTLGSKGALTPSSFISYLGDGWYKISAYFNSSITSTRIYFSDTINDAYGGGASVPIGSTLELAAAQSEAGSYPTSYIPTTTTAVTRVADKSSTTGISALIGQTEGTIYLEGIAATLNADLLGINRSATNAIFITKSNLNAFRVYVYAGGVGLTFTDPNVNTDFYKLAITYKSGNSYLYVNGVKIGATNTSTFTFSAPLNILELAGNYFVGINEQKIQGLMIFQTAKSEAEVAALTTL